MKLQSENDHVSQRLGAVDRGNGFIDIVECIAGCDQLIKLQFTVYIEIDQLGHIGLQLGRTHLAAENTETILGNVRGLEDKPGPR